MIPPRLRPTIPPQLRPYGRAGQLRDLTAGILLDFLIITLAALFTCAVTGISAEAVWPLLVGLLVMWVLRELQAWWRGDLNDPAGEPR